jgi:hypothetical protein
VSDIYDAMRRDLESAMANASRPNAAELRRLRRVNAELLGALRNLARMAEAWEGLVQGRAAETAADAWGVEAARVAGMMKEQARAAIAKAEGVKPPRIEGYNTNRDQPTVTIKEVKP